MGAELSRVDHRAVRDREDRRHPGQHQSGLPHARTGLCAEAVGCPHSGLRDGVQDVGLRRAWSTRSGRTHRNCRRCSSSAPTTGRASSTARSAVAVDELRARHGHARQQPADQHPIHLGHNRFPEGRHAVAPQHPQQRVLHHRADQLRPRRPAVHPGAVLPLLRHGDGQSRLHQPRRHDGHSRAGIRPGTHAGCHRKGKVYSGLRRADDVHRDARRSRPRQPRPVVAAYRHHGRIGLSRRGDEALRQRDEHDRGRHRLRHDRDVTGVMPDAHRRRSRAAHRDRSAASIPTSRSRSSTPTPARSSNVVSPGSSARAATR